MISMNANYARPGLCAEAAAPSSSEPDLAIPAGLDRSNPEVQAKLAHPGVTPKPAGEPMDPFATKTTIKPPKEGSKEAGTRKLREQKEKDAKAKPALPTSARFAKIVEDALPGVPANIAPPVPAKPKAETPTKESAVRTSTKKTAKTAGKPAPKAKKAKPGTERRKKPARTSGARKAAAAPKDKGPNKGESVVALIKAGWTPKATIMEKTGWLDHTVRAFLSRCGKAVKDGGLGLTIERRTHNDAPEYRVAK